MVWPVPSAIVLLPWCATAPSLPLGSTAMVGHATAQPTDRPEHFLGAPFSKKNVLFTQFSHPALISYGHHTFHWVHFLQLFYFFMFQVEIFGNWLSFPYWTWCNDLRCLHFAPKGTSFTCLHIAEGQSGTKHTQQAPFHFYIGGGRVREGVEGTRPAARDLLPP